MSQHSPIPFTKCQAVFIVFHFSVFTLEKRVLTRARRSANTASRAKTFEMVTIPAAASAFQHLSVGLGFRAIPALGSCARQVRALTGFGFPARLSAAPFETTQTIWPGALRKTVSLALRAAPFAPGRPDGSGHERKTKTCFARIASLSSVFSASTLRHAPLQTVPYILAFPSQPA